MSKKQEAEEFVMDFKIDHTVPYIVAKKYALVAVSKIIDVLGREGVYSYADSAVENYYEELKLEIEKL